MPAVEMGMMQCWNIEATDVVRKIPTVSADRVAKPERRFGDCTSTAAAMSVQPELGTGAGSQIRRCLRHQMLSTGCSLIVLMSGSPGIARHRARLGWGRSMSCFAGQAGHSTHRRLQC